MDNAKEYYKTYLADDGISPLSREIVNYILKDNPNSVLEFGCGTGKNLRLIREQEHTYAQSEIKLFGIDVSLINVIHANVKNDLPYICLGDQDLLPKLRNIDVVFTVSVLDHIEYVDDIIKEFKRIAYRVFLAEPLLDKPETFYYAHDYGKHGFVKLPYQWESDGDGNTYYIWEWRQQPRGENGDSFDWVHDDLGKR